MLLNSLFKHWSYRIFAPGTMLREKYEALKQLLNYDIACHEQMAEFQDMLHGGSPEDLAAIRKRFSSFSQRVYGMVEALETMSPGSYVSLKSYHKKFDFYTRFLLAPPKIDFAPPFVLPLQEITADNIQIGNKAKNLAIAQNELEIPVPNGFAVTSSAFHYFIEFNDLRQPIDELLAQVNIHQPQSLSESSRKLQDLILDAEVPPVIIEAMLSAYDSWTEEGSSQIKVAVRSSAISEDGNFSFAGQYATLLDTNRRNIPHAYREVIASKYSSQALFYRICHGLGDEETAMSVLIQEMVPAKSSGVLYTCGISDKEPDTILQLHALPGLGESLVGGTANPDTYTLTKSHPPQLASELPAAPVLSEEQAVKIAQLGLQIENSFASAQDIEWAIDSQDRLFILQARTLHLSNNTSTSAPSHQHDHLLLLDGCQQASPGIAAGSVYQLDSTHQLEDIPDGAILVTRDSPPEYVQVINRLAAVLAEHGSRASHFATVAREFGVPYLTGIPKVCDHFQPGLSVTVDAEKGAVYEGCIETLVSQSSKATQQGQYPRILKEALRFITPLELVDAAGENFTPEGCRSMHDIIRFCHEKALLSMFTTGRPGTGRGALRLVADIPLDVFLFDVGGGFATEVDKQQSIPLEEVASVPFQAIWKGLSHPGVQWKQKPFDWEAYDKIELAGGVPPKKDSFAFASYAVISTDYLHFNIRFGYHFTVLDVMCGENQAENYCMLRFAGGGGDYEQRLLRIDFIAGVLEGLEFTVDKKADLLEAKLPPLPANIMTEKLDMAGRLLGATKLMDMVLVDQQMVAEYVQDFYKGRYSFSQEG